MAPVAPVPAPDPKTSTNAIVGLVLAVLSWILCPIIPAIVALGLARSSSREIAASEGGITGAGLNTATRIISWLNIAVFIVVSLVIAALAAFGVIFTANVASSVNPEINAKTGLADGQYVMNPVVRSVTINDECTYGGLVYTPDDRMNIDAPDLDIYGQGAVQCQDIGRIDAVYFEVQGGIATITSVE